MDAQILRAVGGVAGLAGIAVGMILLLYREIVRKNVFPTLLKRDAYRLLRSIAVLSWSVAMFGILCWAWSNARLHGEGTDSANDTGKASKAAVEQVVAGTVVDGATNAGIGGATIRIEGESSSYTSEDSGNFRIVVPGAQSERVRVLVSRSGYLDADESVVSPTHDLILQLRRR